MTCIEEELIEFSPQKSLASNIVMTGSLLITEGMRTSHLLRSLHESDNTGRSTPNQERAFGKRNSTTND